MPNQPGVTRRQTRDAARAEDSTLAAIIRCCPDAVIASTTDGIVSTWNAAAERFFGFTCEEMVGRSVESLYPADVLAQERARMARVVAGATESGFRCTRLRADGQPTEVLMSLAPVYDPDGMLISVASISRPVTDVERAEARFGSLLEAAPDATICVDGNGRIVSVNAQVEKLFGYDRTELVGSDVELLLPEQMRGVHRGHRAGFMSDPQVRSMGAGQPLTARRRDGSVFPVEISLAPDIAVGSTLVIAAVRDVTAQRAIEATAKESESRLRQLAESVDIVFVLRQLDPPAHLYVSTGSLDVLGRTAEDIMADSDLSSTIVHPDDWERVKRDYVIPYMAGQAAHSEHRIVRPDGSVQWVGATAVPVPNPDGAVERVVITAEDITDRVKVADALRAAESAARTAELAALEAKAAALEAEGLARTANLAKNEFLSRMSHELRTPLNAVLGFGQLLQRQLAGTEHAEAIRHILKGGRHLLDLINDVLDIARIESGEISLSTEPVRVAEIVDETIELMQPLAAAARVTLLAIPGQPGDYVQADRQRLRQILLNLLSNAIKYNSVDGKVWVGWESRGENIALTVGDEGPGISAELQRRLFVPFDRLGAEASGIEGTGIGLALTRSLAELMGGAISVDSAPGEGSRFTLTIATTAPVIAEPLFAAVAHLTGQTHDPKIRPLTLLYIEDNASNVLLVEHLLELRPGWRLLHAATGSLGVELAAGQRPDLILLDLHLPDRSGHDVLLELVRRPGLRETPVVILTADATAGQSRQLLAAGAAGYLTKPLDLDEVLSFLDDAAERRDRSYAGSP